MTGPQMPLPTDPKELMKYARIYARKYSITGWHLDTCPHVTDDMFEPCSEQCLRFREAVAKMVATVEGEF